MVDSPGPAMVRNRLVHSIASALSRVSISAQPPTSSFASENGPSSTVKSPSAYLTLVASSTGASPPVASSTPALVASSTNALIVVYISGLGGGIGTDGSARVYPRNRICLSFAWRAGGGAGACSARASNAGCSDRHSVRDFLGPAERWRLRGADGRPVYRVSVILLHRAIHPEDIRDSTAAPYIGINYHTARATSTISLFCGRRLAAMDPGIDPADPDESPDPSAARSGSARLTPRERPAPARVRLATRPAQREKPASGAREPELSPAIPYDRTVASAIRPVHCIRRWHTGPDSLFSYSLL